MSEPNPPKPVAKPDPAAAPRGASPDDAIDAALKEATGPASARPAQAVPLKRQWDAQLERELEAALAGFDASKYDVETPRRNRAEDRKHVPKGARGQETI